MISAILEKVGQKISNLETRIKPSKSNPILKQPEAIHYLETLDIAPIDKASSNINRCNIKVNLIETGVNGDGVRNYCKPDKRCKEVTGGNTEHTELLSSKTTKMEKNLPSMYLIPKMHKNPIGTHFIITSKLFSTKQIYKSFSSIFKLI